MNTLAKVFRSHNDATAVLAFRPDELGTSSPPSVGSQAFQFPALELTGNFAPLSKAGTNGLRTHDHTFPEVADLPVEIFPSENENNALEKAVREKALQETRVAAEAEMNAQIGRLREELTETISRISGLANELTAKLEMEVVELALEIARKVVAREVSIDQEVVLSVTKNALSKLHTRTLASLHLHPEDLAYVQEHRNKLNYGSLELIEDGLVSPGGCLIHTDTGDIDGRIESQFDEITNGLLGNGAEQ